MPLAVCLLVSGVSLPPMDARTRDLVGRCIYIGAAMMLVGGLILLIAGSSSMLRASGGVYVLIATGLIAVGRLLRSQRGG